MVIEFSQSIKTRTNGRKRKPHAGTFTDKQFGILSSNSLMYNLYTPVCVLTYLYTRVYVPVLVLKQILKYSDIC